jgi:hypothetical protein
MPVGVQVYCNKKELIVFCDYYLAANPLSEREFSDIILG